MKKNFLHLTDLHLKDSTSPEEKLREGFYRDYLLLLKKEVFSSIGKIDAIFCTGDIIDKANIDNFAHAKKVFDYLLKVFEVKQENLFFCLGNHDVKVVDANKGDTTYFDAFVKNYPSRTPIFSTDIYSFYLIEDLDVFVLVFNSVVNSKGLLETDPSTGGVYISPSTWEGYEIDKLFELIDEEIVENKPLIVLSHFPMQLSPRNRVVLEDDKWLAKHLWSTGTTIVDRLFTRREELLTIYLFGDGHLPDFWSENSKVHYIMTGQVGGNFTNPRYKDKAGVEIPYNKTNEVKIISFDDQTFETAFYTGIYLPTGYTFDSQHGKWTINFSKPRIPIQNIKADENIDQSKRVEGRNKTVSISPTIKGERNEAIPLHLIGTSMQPEIIEVIREARLYKFDRFAISDTYTSLGWIKIHELFENKDLLCRCVDKAIEWIQKGITQLEDAVVIGVDYWGAIFASQVSIRTNTTNFCITTKSKGRQAHSYEILDHYSKEIAALNNLKTVIIMCDVISTGNTILNIKQKITSLYDKNVIEFYAFSVISDKHHLTNPDLNSFKSIGTFCMDLPIPIFPNDKLPDELILPPRYDLR